MMRTANAISGVELFWEAVGEGQTEVSGLAYAAGLGMFLDGGARAAAAQVEIGTLDAVRTRVSGQLSEFQRTGAR